MSARRSSVVRQLCLSASLLALGALVTSCTESAAAAPTAPRSPATTPAMSSSGSYSSSTSGSGAGSGAESEKNDDEEAALRALTASVNALITRVTALESSTLAARVTALENSTIGTRVSALETKVAGFDLLSARVLKLENVPTTAADLVGTYTGLGTTFDLLSGSGPSVVHAVGSVTLTLASGGAAGAIGASAPSRARVAHLRAGEAGFVHPGGGQRGMERLAHALQFTPHCFC